MRSFPFIPILATAAAAQQVPTRTLTKPDVEYTEPFSQLVAAYELRDGRIVAADTRDKTLQAIDLRASKATAIGREGAGPQEWGLPTGVFAWRADSVLVNDMLNNRYLILAPDGKPVRTYNPAADAAVAADAARGGRGGDGRGARGDAGGGRAMSFGGPGGARVIGGGGAIRGTDLRGRIYSQDAALTIGADGSISSADSAPIVRFDPATDKRDTVAYVMLAKNSTSGAARNSGGNQTVSIRVGGGMPFAPADDWTVLRDGSVVIVRVADYHLEVISPTGRRIVGRPVPFTPVRVTEADKQQWRDAQRSGGVRMTQSFGGGGRGAAPPNLPPPAEPDAWPETKPPFLASRLNASVFAAPNGDIWIVRTRSANDKIPTADVFSSQGQLIGRVAFPEKTRLVALGPKGVYTARSDEDDLQYLQRHAIQWTGCAPEIKEVCGARH